LPKRGFTNIFKKEYAIINVGDLKDFAPNSTLDVEVLKKAGLVKGRNDGVKILGNGEISHPVTIKVKKASKSAQRKIEAAGGRVEII
jgi:large subunit ribosomal protein L15